MELLGNANFQGAIAEGQQSVNMDCVMSCHGLSCHGLCHHVSCAVFHVSCLVFSSGSSTPHDHKRKLADDDSKENGKKVKIDA